MTTQTLPQANQITHIARNNDVFSLVFTAEYTQYDWQKVSRKYSACLETVKTRQVGVSTSDVAEFQEWLGTLGIAPDMSQLSVVEEAVVEGKRKAVVWTARVKHVD